MTLLQDFLSPARDPAGSSANEISISLVSIPFVRRKTHPFLDPKKIYSAFRSVDWLQDNMKDCRSRLSRPPSIFNGSQTWILIFITGTSIGVCSAFISIVCAWMTDFKQGFCKSQWYLPKEICCKGLQKTLNSEHCDDFVPWSNLAFGMNEFSLFNYSVYIVLSVLMATICAILVKNLGKNAAGSGSPEIKTILGGFIIDGFLSATTLCVKSLALPLSIASGLCVGKEGPMIHIACCIGSVFLPFFSDYENNEAKKREILSAASAAGVAVAFGSPIGGVMFSLEELSSFFPTRTMIQSFFCALVASVTLQLIDPFRGKRVMFQVIHSRNWYIWYY